jgi:hypothetical protein
MTLKDDDFKIRGTEHKLKIALNIKVVLTYINEIVLTSVIIASIRMRAPISGASQVQQRKPGGHPCPAMEHTEQMRRQIRPPE